MFFYSLEQSRVSCKSSASKMEQRSFSKMGDILQPESTRPRLMKQAGTILV